ncbi:unnamed protein product, partial [Staurois parvus]
MYVKWFETKMKFFLNFYICRRFRPPMSRRSQGPEHVNRCWHRREEMAKDAAGDA